MKDTSLTRSVEAEGLPSFAQVVNLALFSAVETLTSMEDCAREEGGWSQDEEGAFCSLLLVRSLIEKMQKAPPLTIEEFDAAWHGVAGIVGMATKLFQMEGGYRNLLMALDRDVSCTAKLVSCVWWELKRAGHA